jgi:hypothetical protein
MEAYMLPFYTCYYFIKLLIGPVSHADLPMDISGLKDFYFLCLEAGHVHLLEIGFRPTL